jgi:phytoene/squalene synthetase
MKSSVQTDLQLAAAMTHAASRQTALTIRWLVDRGKVEDAYRTYGYFRWVDDWLDQETRPRQERLAFVVRQKNLMDACYGAELTGALTLEETMLVNLIERDGEANSGLQAYIRNMMSVMAFDAERRERLISQHELDEYTGWLATAVTEAMHHFIGHGRNAPTGAARYQAVTGAHITHMLRDALDDADAGYYNIPSEVLFAHAIQPGDVRAPAYRAWVKERVQKARECFNQGRLYMAQVESLRCRLAGYAYMRRFEMVLNSIEQDGYLLRKQYPELEKGGTAVESIIRAFWMAMKDRRIPSLSSSSALPIR